MVYYYYYNNFYYYWCGISIWANGCVLGDCMGVICVDMSTPSLVEGESNVMLYYNYYKVNVFF